MFLNFILPTHLRLLLALAFSVAAGTTLADVEHVAIVKTVEGKLEILRDGSSSAAASGDQLFVSDQLRSAVGATAGIVFKDGTLLTVGPSTDIKLRDYAYEPKESKYAFSLYLDKGSAIYSSGQIGKLAPQAVKVDSPTASVGVRGTRFIITAD